MAHERPFIVAIGASAGGVEALQGFMEALPDDNGIAIVVVTHLASDYDSILDEILSRYTSCPVVEIEDGMSLSPNQVHVLPYEGTLTIANGKLKFVKTKIKQRNNIDVFFSSLAEDQKEYSIGILLSGGGSDGTLGIKAIKEHGGLTVAQGSDGTVPLNADMPDSAIAAGVVDIVLPVGEIPAQLLEYVRSFDALKDLNEGEDERVKKNRKLEEKLTTARKEIYSILRKQVGHDFSGYKTKTFMRRVQRRMQVRQLGKIESYIECLRKDTDEVSLLFRDLLIGVTGFFRDEEAFENLEKSVIPQLFDGKGADATIRIWIPGCSTGEEVYTFAILMREYINKLQATPRVQIFATDIDDVALGVARTGRYPASMLSKVSKEKLSRFFFKDDGSYVITKEIRDLCIFSSHSIVRDPPFSRMDMISCRNLLIYLGIELQRQIIPLFHYALQPGGYLFLGASENVTQFSELFKPLDRKHRIFQRCDDVTAPAQFPFSVHNSRLNNTGQKLQGKPASHGSQLRQSVERVILERFAPSHIVVNKDGDVVYYSSRTGKYVEAASGAPSRHLLGMVRKNLRLDLRSVLHEAMEKRKPVESTDIPLDIGDKVQFVTIRVEPFGEAGDDPHFIVIFKDTSPLMSQSEVKRGKEVSEHNNAIEPLEKELRDTRERLQSTIEEYETALEELKSSNEEMVSVNEELQSTNEEMETSKEELQSVNEELHTVNLELNEKVEEIDQANRDLKNLYNSTNIPTLFLDRKLAIRSFTPASTEIFKILPSDRGRPLTDFVSELDYPGLSADIMQVLTLETAIEKRVTDKSGSVHYLARFLPYQKSGTENEGVVISFLDVTSLAKAEEHRNLLVAELNHRVRNMLSVVIALGQQTIQKNPSREAVNIFFDRLHALARTYALLSEENWRPLPLDEVAKAELSPFEIDKKRKRIFLKGPQFYLVPKAALSFGMIFHELATNAAKYGALSREEGSVHVSWRTEGHDSQARLIVDWLEKDGPTVKPPARKGFGSNMIDQEIGYGLKGTIKTRYHKDGFHAYMEAPMASCISSVEAQEESYDT